MKKTLLLSLLLLAAGTIPAQFTWGYAVLDINSVRAGVNSNGDLFWNYSTNTYEVPAGGSAQTIFAGALWIGGLDTGGQLHLAAQTYRQSGNDFFNGPCMNPANYSAANDLLWAQVWKINKSTIDTFLIWQANPSLFPNYTIPPSIASWPGNGDVSQGQAPQLAPYVDTDGDGTYSAISGDYPCIKGDQAIFYIFNDDRAAHTETGGQKFGIEIHCMMHAYKSPGTWLDSTVFINYRLYNRTANDYDSLYLGSWTDFDIGSYDDDYIGCDVQRNMYYGYNGDINDGTSALPTVGTYGANPPAQGVLFLRGPEPVLNDGVDNDHDGQADEPNEFCSFNRFVYYNNNFSVTGNPSTDWDYYKYMQGRWLDSSYITYGGNGYGGMIPYPYMFPGTSDTSVALWSEASEGNTPFDRRGLGVSGPFPLPAYKEMCIDFAYIFGRGNNGPASGIAAMQQAADSATAFYANTTPCLCTPNPLGLAEHEQRQIIHAYPNPSAGTFSFYWPLKSGDAQVEVYNINGERLISCRLAANNSDIQLEAYPPGVYLLRIIDGNSVATARLVKE